MDQSLPMAVESSTLSSVQSITPPAENAAQELGPDPSQSSQRAMTLPGAEAQRQFWLVTADPKQYDWDIAFRAGTVRWTEARGPEAQKNIRATHPGDVVLAYRSTPDQYIAGLGHVAGPPYRVGPDDEQRYAVQIDMDRKLDEGVYLNDLRKAVPDLQHVARRRPVSFSPVEPRQWAVIRELILQRNPSLAPTDLPPAPSTSAKGTLTLRDIPGKEFLVPELVQAAVKGTLTLKDIPDNMLWPGEPFVYPVEVTNLGTAPWAAEGDYAVALSYRISVPDGRLAPVVSRWPLPQPVPAGESASFDVPLTAPLAAGEYQVEWWLEYRDPSSGYARVEGSEGGPFTFRVTTFDQAKEHVGRLLTPGAMPADERRGEMQRIGRVVQADTDPGLRRLLVEEALLPAVYDADWQVGRSALQALYDIRQSYKGLEELLRATLRDRTDERAAAEALADQPIGAEVEKWLRGLLPAYGVRILDAELPDNVRAQDRLLLSLRVQNTGDVRWPADEVLRVSWQWWPRGKGRRGTPAHHWEWTREPGEPVAPNGEASFEVDLTVPDEPGTYNTEWSVSGQAWGETKPARREGSVVVWPAILPVDALFGSDRQAALAAVHTLYERRSGDVERQVSEALATRRGELDRVATWAADTSLEAPVRQWLASLYPPEAFRLEIDRAEWPDPLPAGSSCAPILHLLNKGDLSWQVGDLLSVTLDWQATGKTALSLPTATWNEVALAERTAPGQAAALALSPIEVPAQPGGYVTRWTVRGASWDARAERTTSLVITAAPPPYAALLHWRTTPPTRAWPGQQLALDLEIENQGTEAWTPGGPDAVAVQVSLRPAQQDRPVAQETAYPLPAVASRQRTVLAESYRLPDEAGAYLLSCQAVRNTAPLGEPLHATLSILDVDQAGLPELLTDVPPGLPAPVRARRLEQIGKRLLDPALSADQRHDDAGRYLVPALFSNSLSESRAALGALYALAHPDGGPAVQDSALDDLLRRAMEDHQDSLEPLARLARSGEVDADVRRWLNHYLPEPAPVPAVSAAVVAAPVVISMPIVQLEPPPADHTVTVNIAPDVVTLTYGDRTFASPNEIQSQELEDARSRPPLTYGQQLFAGVFNPRRVGSSDSTYDGYVIARSQARQKLRLELRVDDPTVPDYQWEYMRNPNEVAADSRPAPPLAVYADAPFYRRYDNGRQYTPVEARPLRILVAICNPITLRTKLYPDGKKVPLHIAGLSELDVDLELGIIKPGLDHLQAAGIADYRILESKHGDPVTFEDIAEELEDGYHVLHILAHGLFLNGTFQLLMEDEHRVHRLVPAHRFEAPQFGNNLRLVVLAACQSAARNVQGGLALPGLGQLLVKRGVQAAIAMQDAIDVEAAQLFARRFYDDLARTGRIDMAMAATRYDLYQDKPDHWDWGIPVLFMSSQDGRLFTVDERLAQRAAADRPTLAELKKQVKSYGELPGGGDPTAQVVMDAVQAQVQAAYDNPALLSALRAVIAPSAARIGADKALPLAREQDRVTLDRLTHQVDLDAAHLSGFVKDRTRMEIPLIVYQQACSALNAGKHLVLTGPPGCGKTSLAQAICQYAQEQGHYTRGMAMTTATADWTTFDTIGGYVPTEQQTLEFRPGNLLEAVAKGRWLVIDEINRAEIDKAFGELFTVLSGQGVDLPYSVQRQPVRILSASEPDDSRHPAPLFWARHATSGYDYVVPPSWRIIGTMNVYDKSYLYNMSFAFMRRFAFVDVDLPDRALYHGLLEIWFDRGGLPLQADPANDAPGMKALRHTLQELIERDNALMRRRALGPAIVKDAVAYIGDRYRKSGQRDEELQKYLGEAFQLYIVPQLDGLDHEGILDVYGCVDLLFEGLARLGDGGEELRRVIHHRIELLYPHIQPDDWAGRLRQARKEQPPTDDG